MEKGELEFVLRPEEFEVSGGIRNGKIKWISGFTLLERLGFNPAKCHITIDSTGNLSIRQKRRVDYTCAPKLWRRLSN